CNWSLVISTGSALDIRLSTSYVLAASRQGEIMTKTAKLLSELIALPSVNPAFLPANDPHSGEQRVADFVAATARRAGLQIEFQPVLPKRSNVLIKLTPRSKVRRRLLLAPHLDTVGGAEVPGTLFTPRARTGRLFGRGA